MALWRAALRGASPAVAPALASSAESRRQGLRQPGRRWQPPPSPANTCRNAPPGFDRVEVVRLMADLLWRGQIDRHGRNPLLGAVTQEEAEAAVHLATVVVQWFTAGSVRRLVE